MTLIYCIVGWSVVCVRSSVLLVCIGCLPSWVATPEPISGMLAALLEAGAWISGRCAAVPTTRRCVICEAERVNQLLQRSFSAMHRLKTYLRSTMTTERLNSMMDLHMQRSATKFGARSFAVAAPSEWNRLPLHIHSKPSVNCFKVALKSFLFITDSS